MSAVISDRPELLKLLAEHPELRAELRCLLLSKELLHLPEAVAELRQAQERFAQNQEKLQQAILGLTESQGATQAELRALAEAQKATQAEGRALAEA